MNDFLDHPFTHPFSLGFYVCGIFLFFVLYNHLKLKLEHSRYRSMLSDKLEIEASTMSRLKGETDGLRKENENLRVKIQILSEQPEIKLAHDLEIFARAEKKMMVAAPGFAGPWEQAKQAAYQEVAEEEAGKSVPRRLFQKFFGNTVHAAVPIGESAQKALTNSEVPKSDHSSRI